MNYTSKNPNFLSVIEKVLEKQYFMKLVGIEMETCTPGKVLLSLILAEKHMQQAHFVHGGVISTMADIAMGFSALTLAEQGKSMVTADLHLSYHRPGQGEKLMVEAWVAKPGNTLYFCEAQLWTLDKNEKQTIIAKAFSTMCTVDINH